MKDLKNLIEKNCEWSKSINLMDPKFFETLSQQQAPEYLWIGCSDSRVPANQIVDLLPGELFVHRNVANLVVHTDINCLSVLQYAVEVLKVKHIMVVGHYGCGGVNAALKNESLGLIDNWLRHIFDISQKHSEILDIIKDDTDRLDRLCELNVLEQARNICGTSIVKKAWKDNRELCVHAWIYGLNNGLITDLGFQVSNLEEVDPSYSKVCEIIKSKAKR